MKTKLWRDKTENPGTNVGFVRIGYISYIEFENQRIPQLESMRIYSSDCDSDAKWKLFCLENKIEKWCYLEEIINL